MGDSKIEWTDATWNPVRGCTKVSPGCANCYAETFAERWRGVPGHPYEQGFDLRLVPEKLAEPLSWKKPRRVFVNSMSDLFQDGVPDAFIDRAFAVMALAPQHTFQVLTKRADRMRAYVSDPATPARIDAVFLTNEFDLNGGRVCLVQRGRVEGWPLPNVWLGVSVENQHFADERIPLLLDTPAAVRFISAEPLLGAISFRWAKWDDSAPHHRRVNQLPPVERDGRILAGSVEHLDGLRMLDWVIVGGESGPGARPCRVEWLADIAKACRSAHVPVFVKQVGSVPYVRAARLRHWEWRDIKRPEDKRFTEAPDDALGWRVHLSDRKGGDMAEWPEDLRVRQFPEMAQR